MIQHELFEPSTYHDVTKWGYFALMVQHPEGKRQSMYLLRDMPRIIPLMDPKLDSWISQAEFEQRRRRVVDLLRIGLCFVDLDTYNIPGLVNRPPDELANLALLYMDQEGIPEPSMIVYSGRGLQLKWLLTGILPRRALPRWKRVQTALVNSLENFGADHKAKDAARVLRLDRTVNTKSGEMVHVIRVREDEDGNPYRYNFEYLAETMLPFTRKEMKREREQQRPAGKPINGMNLAWDRLEDLRSLGKLRGGWLEGSRMNALFWQVDFMLLSGVCNSSDLYREAASLANRIDPEWNYRSAELSTLYEKAKRHGSGQMIDIDGRTISPLYTPRNDTLMNLFSITPDEERQLKTIISRTEKERRRRERREIKRRDAGAVPRSEYEAGSLSKLKPWEAVGMSRAKWYRKGKPGAVAQVLHTTGDEAREA